MGAGIFVVTGEAAYKYAGPAVVLSFALAGACSSVYAICFAELAAMVSKAGSAYTYSKEAFGNGVGFVVGWCLLAEYIFCVKMVYDDGQHLWSASKAFSTRYGGKAA